MSSLALAAASDVAVAYLSSFLLAFADLVARVSN